MNFINKVSKWDQGTIIQIDNKNSFVSKQKFPLIVIDPVQPNRNVAAALRDDKFDLFVDLCKKFKREKSFKYFKEKKVNLSRYNLVLKITPLKGSNDVVGTKILKCYEATGSRLGSLGFDILDSGWFWKDYAYLYFKIKNKTLSKYQKHYGPPIKFENDLNKFKQKYKRFKVKEEKGTSYVIIPRKFNTLEKAIRHIIKDNEIKGRIKTISIINQKLYK